MLQINEENKGFIRRAATLALPIALQGLLNNVLNVVDTMMIGGLGESPLAAAGLANKVFFVLSLLLFGIASGSNVLTAQYWGNQDVKNARKVLGMSLLLGCSAALIFFMAGVFIPEKVMGIFTNLPGTIELGAGYLSIVALSYPFQAISQCYIMFQRAVNKVRLTVTVTMVAIGINIILNYTLIYGKFGFPEMGIRGAALGTLIARAFECIVIVVAVYLSKGAGAAKPKELWSFDTFFIGRYVRTVTPVIFNEFLWGLGVTMYSLVYGRMGDATVATMTVTQIVEEMFVAAFMGLASATGVVLGNEIGAGKLKQAKQHGKWILCFEVFLSLALAVVLFFVRGFIASAFNITPEVTADVKLCLLIFCLYMPAKMYNYVNIVGVLRSGGDTRFTLFLDFSGVWLIGVPMAFIGGLWLKQPVYVVYALVLAEEIYKAIVGFGRYRSEKWLKRIVE